jgi:hypothetical protein
MEKLHYCSDANEKSVKSKAGHLQVTELFSGQQDISPENGWMGTLVCW